MSRRLTCLVLLGALLSSPDAASAQQKPRPNTEASLNAVDVASEIMVQQDGDKIRFWIDDQRTDRLGRELTEGTVFATKQPITISAFQFNPLEKKIKVTVKSATNSSSERIGELVKALAGIPLIVKPSLAGGSEDSADRAARIAGGAPGVAGCLKEVTNIVNFVNEFDELLFSDVASSEKLRIEYSEWRGAISSGFTPGRNGSDAVMAGVNRIKKYEATLRDEIAGLQDKIDQVNREAGATAPSGQVCRSYQIAAYQFLRIAGGGQTRLASLRKLLRSVTDLEEGLTTNFGKSGDWSGQSYAAAEDVAVSERDDADVAIELNDIEVEVGDLAFSQKEKKGASTSFTVQLDTGWVTEIGVGLTMAFAKQPKYGTTKDSEGRIVVGEAKQQEFSLEPTILLNFIPRRAHRSLRPIVQIGAATSKDSPAIFSGIGGRLFGPTNRLVFGVGAVTAWVKDLTKLKPTDPVDGTAAIESDMKLKAKPRFGWYFSVQYKFD